MLFQPEWTEALPCDNPTCCFTKTDNSEQELADDVAVSRAIRRDVPGWEMF